jgi:hypothetical protein
MSSDGRFIGCDVYSAVTRFLLVDSERLSHLQFEFRRSTVLPLKLEFFSPAPNHLILTIAIIRLKLNDLKKQMGLISAMTNTYFNSLKLMELIRRDSSANEYSNRVILLPTSPQS